MAENIKSVRKEQLLARPKEKAARDKSVSFM